MMETACLFLVIEPPQELGQVQLRKVDEPLLLAGGDRDRRLGPVFADNRVVRV
jgi:hypothetical protein